MNNSNNKIGALEPRQVCSEPQSKAFLSPEPWSRKPLWDPEG